MNALKYTNSLAKAGTSKCPRGAPVLGAAICENPLRLFSRSCPADLLAVWNRSGALALGPLLRPGTGALRPLLRPRRARSLCCLMLFWMLGVGAWNLRAATVPAAEKLLPDDTLFVLTAPDFPKLRDILKASPQNQFWNDPAMKPFRDNFFSKWREDVVKPLERDLDLRLDDYTNLPQGQVTFAVMQNGWQGSPGGNPGFVLLLDSKGQSRQLKNNLARLRKKWVDSARTLRTEKIREFEFSVLSLSSNDLPISLKQFVPQPQEVQELGPDGEPKVILPVKTELVIGQADTLLVMANSLKAAEKIIVRLTGGSLPGVDGLAAFQSSQPMWRDAPLYAWVNVKAIVDVYLHKAAEKTEPDSEVPDPFAGPKKDKLLNALGISGIRSAAASFQNSNEGFLLQGFISVPESERRGLVKILAGETKDCAPPPFVPMDVVKFQRWRLDGQKTWASVEKMMAEIDPRFIGSLNFILETAGARAKERDPGYDLKKSLLTNLGDDIVTYEKAPRSPAPEDLKSPPSVTLLGSPRPDELAVALKALFVIFPGADSASEREFLGRKVFSTPAPNIPSPMSDASRPAAAGTLNYAASGGYVAISTDVSALEEYLRSNNSQAKSLRETVALPDASQRVTGPGTDLFGFENQAETLRASFEAARKTAAVTNVPASGFSPLPGSLGLAVPEKSVRDWMDFSLLPPFERVAKYFHFTVYGGSVSVDGLGFKYFAPTPPALKGGEPATTAAKF